MQKQDGRAQRSLQLIRDAFIELIIERGFDNVTVSAIAQRAGVNRATFYRHYTDKYDLADRLTDVLFADAQLQVTADNLDVQAVRTAMFQHVESYAVFYRAVLGPRGIPGFADRVRDEVEEQIGRILPAIGFDESRLSMPAALPIRYLAAAQVGLIQWWLENDMPFPAEEAAGYLLELQAQGGFAALGLGAADPSVASADTIEKR